MSTTARSETRHTEELWSASPIHQSGASRSVDLWCHSFIATLNVVLPNDLGTADELCERRLLQFAARIVACVNGCAGVADPLAVAEVLEACEALLKFADHPIAQLFGIKPDVSSINAIRRAVAHARGVAPGGEGGGKHGIDTVGDKAEGLI